MKIDDLDADINEEFTRMIEEDAILMGGVQNASSGIISPNSSSTDNSIQINHGDYHAIDFKDTLGIYKPGDGVMSTKNNYTGNGLSSLNIQQRNPKPKNFIFEDKTSLIKRLVLPDIEDENEKEEFKKTLIDFFKKHSNYENKIDWNKLKTLTRKDFEPLLDLEDNTKSAYRRIQKNIKNIGNVSDEIKMIFKSTSGESERKFEYVGENDNWMFFGILNHNAARFCDLDVNQGGGAKWCIGENDEGRHWNYYIDELHSYFIMAFNRNFKSMSREELRNNLKYMIQKDEKGNYHLWNQVDDDEGEVLHVVGTNKVELDKMFEKVIPLVDEEKEKIAKEANSKVKEILENCGNEIDKDTIPGEYKVKITEITIPDSVKEIGEGAFTHCENLKSINIPDGVTEIKRGVFSHCYKLESITIPDSVTEIGEWAFYGCTNLKSINIPDSVEKIGRWAVANCENLESINIPNSVTKIEESTFTYCFNLKSITIPDSVTLIDDRAFYSCKNLESITIPDSVEEIGGWVFAWCINLESVIIPDSVTRIGDVAFEHCHNLKSINIPDSVTLIGYRVFNECNPNITITVSRNFNRKILRYARIPETAKFNVV